MKTPKRNALSSIYFIYIKSISRWIVRHVDNVRDDSNQDLTIIGPANFNFKVSECLAEIRIRNPYAYRFVLKNINSIVSLNESKFAMLADGIVALPPEFTDRKNYLVFISRLLIQRAVFSKFIKYRCLPFMKSSERLENIVNNWTEYFWMGKT